MLLHNNHYKNTDYICAGDCIIKCKFCKKTGHDINNCISEKIQTLDEEAKDVSFFSIKAFTPFYISNADFYNHSLCFLVIIFIYKNAFKYINI
jgi:hypothetical protein